MQNIKGFIRKHYVIAALIISVLYTVIAIVLFFGFDWGPNPIFSPPQVMLLPGGVGATPLLIIPVAYCDLTVPQTDPSCAADWYSRKPQCVAVKDARQRCGDAIFPMEDQGVLLMALMGTMNVLVIWGMLVLFFKIWAGGKTQTLDK